MLDEDNDIRNFINQNSKQPVSLAASKLSNKDYNTKSKQNLNDSNTFEDILTCFICMSRLKHAQMCPQCSKLVCEPCIRKWLTEQKSECPHCRTPLRLSKLVNCKSFISEITNAIDTLKGTNEQIQQKQNQMQEEKCSLHDDNNTQYFCKDCQIPICADCLIYETSHKSHQFEKISKLYEQQVNKINEQINFLLKRLNDLSSQKDNLEGMIDQVTKQKEEQQQELANYFEQLNVRIEQDLRSKLFQLMTQKGTIGEEIEFLENMKVELNTQIKQAPKSTLILKTEEMIKMLQEINSKPIPKDFVNRQMLKKMDLISEIVPEYDSAVFILENYSQKRNVQELVYSNPLFVNDIQWRLKVYPNGNGVAKNNYLSVFLEMTKGCQASQKYEYRVEMVNQQNPSQCISREFSSDFETGECWGYNRFFKLEQLEREGYLNPQEDKIVLKFFVRCPNYYQVSNDQKRYIKEMEFQREQNIKQIEEYQKKLKLVIEENKTLSNQHNIQTNRTEYQQESDLEQLQQQISIQQMSQKYDQTQYEQQFQLESIQNQENINLNENLNRKIENVNNNIKGNRGFKVENKIDLNKFQLDDIIQSIIIDPYELNSEKQKSENCNKDLNSKNNNNNKLNNTSSYQQQQQQQQQQAEGNKRDFSNSSSLKKKIKENREQFDYFKSEEEEDDDDDEEEDQENFGEEEQQNQQYEANDDEDTETEEEKSEKKLNLDELFQKNQTSKSNNFNKESKDYKEDMKEEEFQKLIEGYITGNQVGLVQQNSGEQLQFSSNTEQSDQQEQQQKSQQESSDIQYIYKKNEKNTNSNLITGDDNLNMQLLLQEKINQINSQKQEQEESEKSCSENWENYEQMNLNDFEITKKKNIFLQNLQNEKLENQLEQKMNEININLNENYQNETGLNQDQQVENSMSVDDISDKIDKLRLVENEFPLEQELQKLVLQPQSQNLQFQGKYISDNNQQNDDEDSSEDVQKVRKNLLKQFDQEANNANAQNKVCTSMQNFSGYIGSNKNNNNNNNNNSKLKLQVQQKSNTTSELKNNIKAFKDSQKQRYELEKNIFAMNAMNFSEKLIKKLNKIKDMDQSNEVEEQPEE